MTWGASRGKSRSVSGGGGELKQGSQLGGGGGFLKGQVLTICGVGLRVWVGAKKKTISVKLSTGGGLQKISIDGNLYLPKFLKTCI